MLNLVFKDILIQKKSFYTTVLFYPLFVILAFQGMPEGMLTMGSFFVAYILIFGAFAYDEKARSDVFMLSLPVKKVDIVKARYLSFIIFTILGTLIMCLYINIAKMLNIDINLGKISITRITLNMLAIIIIYSAYIPIMYKCGFSKTRVISVFVFIGLGTVLPLAENILSEVNGLNILKTLISEPVWITSIISILTAILALFISINISIKVYSNREF